MAKVIFLAIQPRVPPQTGDWLSLKKDQTGHLIISGDHHHLPLHNQVVKSESNNLKTKGRCRIIFWWVLYFVYWLQQLLLCVTKSWVSTALKRQEHTSTRDKGMIHFSGRLSDTFPFHPPYTGQLGAACSSSCDGQLQMGTILSR